MSSENDSDIMEIFECDSNDQRENITEKEDPTAETSRPANDNQTPLSSICDGESTDKCIRCTDCDTKIHYMCTLLPSYQVYNLINTKRII